MESPHVIFKIHKEKFELEVKNLYLYYLFVWSYSFEDLTLIISILIRNILSIISHGFTYPIGYRIIRFVVIASWINDIYLLFSSAGDNLIDFFL